MVNVKYGHLTIIAAEGNQDEGAHNDRSRIADRTVPIIAVKNKTS